MKNLQVLRERNFRWFFLAQCASLFGDYMVPTALAFAVLGLTGSGADLGVVLAAGAVPRVLLMLAGGVIADRLPRHAVMIGADLARLAGQGLMAGLLLTGHARIWQLVVLQIVHGCASALFMPAISGMMQSTTDSATRQAGNALRSMGQSCTYIAGPALAGVLVVTVGSGWAIGADAASFAISALCLSQVRLPANGRRLEVQNFLRDMLDGWRAFRSRRWVWSVILSQGLGNTLYTAFTVLGPLVSARSLGGAGAWAAIMSTFGTGCLAGGVLGLRIRARYTLRAATALGGLFAMPTLGLALGGSLAVAMAGAFLGGIGMMVMNTLWETTLQTHIPEESLSRVSAYEWVGSLALQPLGLAVVAPIAAGLGIREVLWSAGLAHLAIILYPLLLPDVRGLLNHGYRLDTGREAVIGGSVGQE